MIFTVNQESQGSYKEKGSRFESRLLPFSDPSQLEAIIKSSKKANLKSRHHCFAYQIGFSKEQFRMTDDGEPSGTAGKPLYGQLVKQNISDALLLCVRFFGGTKLGVPGLIHAYRSSAEQAIKNATLLKKYETQRWSLSCGYDGVDRIMNYLSKERLHIDVQQFLETCTLELVIKEEDCNQHLSALRKLASINLKCLNEKEPFIF